MPVSCDAESLGSRSAWWRVPPVRYPTCLAGNPPMNAPTTHRCRPGPGGRLYVYTSVCVCDRRCPRPGAVRARSLSVSGRCPLAVRWTPARHHFLPPLTARARCALCVHSAPSAGRAAGARKCSVSAGVGVTSIWEILVVRGFIQIHVGNDQCSVRRLRFCNHFSALCASYKLSILHGSAAYSAPFYQ